MKDENVQHHTRSFWAQLAQHFRENPEIQAALKDLVQEIVRESLPEIRQMSLTLVKTPEVGQTLNSVGTRVARSLRLSPDFQDHMKALMLKSVQEPSFKESSLKMGRLMVGTPLVTGTMRETLAEAINQEEVQAALGQHMGSAMSKACEEPSFQKEMNQWMQTLSANTRLLEAAGDWTRQSATHAVNPKSWSWLK